MHFLFDATDLKQSVESALKVEGKSLTTFLDEVHFIVNLYSFPLPLVPQANPSPRSVICSLSGRTTSKTPPSPRLVLLTPFFEDIPTPRLEPTKW